MGGEDEHALLEAVVRRLVAELSPQRIYLFGSRARDDADASSDWDILVVVGESDLPGHRRDQLALRALRGLPIAVDVMVLTQAEFDRQREVVCSLTATVLREGKLLHAA